MAKGIKNRHHSDWALSYVSLYFFSACFLPWTTALIVPAAVKPFTMILLFAVEISVKIVTSILKPMNSRRGKGAVEFEMFAGVALDSR